MSEFLLMQLDYAKVAGILVRRDTNTDWGRPDDVSDDTVTGLAPMLLNVHKEGLELGDNVL